MSKQKKAEEAAEAKQLASVHEAKSVYGFVFVASFMSLVGFMLSLPLYTDAKITLNLLIGPGLMFSAGTLAVSFLKLLHLFVQNEHFKFLESPPDHHS